MKDLPTLYEDVMSRIDTNKLQNAMNEEMNALSENDIFELTTLPPDRKADWFMQLK